MGEFVCRVADIHGRVFSHVEAAASLEEARQKLTERGLYVYSVNPRSGLVRGLRRQGPRALGGSDFLILNQQFNTLIKAGLPILRALDLLADRASSPRLRPVLSQIRDRVREGKSLSEAVDEAAVFSKVYSTAILAGENSGHAGIPGAAGGRGYGHCQLLGRCSDTQICDVISRSGRPVAGPYETSGYDRRG